MHLARIAPIVLLAVILAPAAPAVAAPISQITWDVVGGSFSSSALANGPVTGGTVVWTPGAGTADTASAAFHPGTFNFLATAAGGLQHFSLPAAYGSVYLAPGSYVGVFSSFFHGQAASAGGLFPAPPGGGFPTLASIIRTIFITGGTGTASFLHVSGFSAQTANHYLLLGNEVKTFVPEPATGSLLGLGLIGLAGFTAAARRQLPRRP